MDILRPTVARIHHHRLARNLQRVRELLSPGQRVMAVIKADAYGHGAVSVARTLEANGVAWLAVALVEEGLSLRRAGVDTPILCLEGFPPGAEPIAIEAKLTPAVVDGADVERLDSIARGLDRRVDFHLKVDTGMSRLGVLPSEMPALLEALEGSSHLRLDGFFSHLAVAEDPEGEGTLGQVALAKEALDSVLASGHRPRWRHLCNSAGIVGQVGGPEWNLVRPGILLFGALPTLSQPSALKLDPVMQFETRIYQLRTIPAGQGVSYGWTHVTERESVLAVLPVGYADGFQRALNGQLSLRLAQGSARLVGAICMDLCLLDLTDLPGVRQGEGVTLLGADPSIEDWTNALGCSPYEVTCGISPRVPRIHHELGARCGEDQELG